MDRRQLLKTAAGAGAAALLARCGGGENAAAPRPNILVVMTDDQAANQMSCAGHALLNTPALDRIANEGVRFTNSFCTNSLCAPGRAAVLTGTYSHVNGILGNSESGNEIEKLSTEIPTYPQLLQQAGYRTGMMGKWHLSTDPVGFDDWKILPGQGVYFDPEFIINGERKTVPGYVTDLTTDFAIEFLEQDRGEQPFCLVYQHKAPHRPFTPAPRHADLYNDIEWPYPETYNDDYATRDVAARAEDMRFEVSLKPDYDDIPAGLSAEDERNWIFQRFMKDHHRTLSAVDEGVGRILDYLDEKGLAEDTLVIYTSDNGFYLGDHGWYDKRFMYEPSLRIPRLLRYPRMVKAGQVDAHFVQHQDIAPTVLDFAGVAIPEVVQGRSVRPVVEGTPPEDWCRSMFYSYHEDSWSRSLVPGFNPGRYGTPHRVTPHRGVRTDRYKLIEYYKEGDYWELFDLAEDPNELRNVYSDPANAELIADLATQLRALQEQYGATDEVTSQPVEG